MASKLAVLGIRQNNMTELKSMSPEKIEEKKGPSITLQKNESKREFVREIVWPNVITYTVLHASALYGAYLMFTSAKFATSISVFVLYLLSGFGITAGAHRLWSHKAYKANFPLRVFLMILNTMAHQGSIWRWVRDHRLHHKYCETNADPHNVNRGFFFSHVGWTLMRKHPDVKEKGKGIDLSDLEADPVVVFQKKYYPYMMPLMTFVLPTIIPMYLWGETFSNSFFGPTILRYTLLLNFTFLGNSVAHSLGGKPYDKNISAVENFAVAIGTLGDGWHNYHHVFPWDYKAAELGDYSLNWTTGFIESFAKIGWASDLKRVSTEIIKKRCRRTGDGSHEIWGWGDKDQHEDERKAAIIEHVKEE